MKYNLAPLKSMAKILLTSVRQEFYKLCTAKLSTGFQNSYQYINHTISMSLLKYMAKILMKTSRAITIVWIIIISFQLVLQKNGDKMWL